MSNPEEQNAALPSVTGSEEEATLDAVVAPPSDDAVEAPVETAPTDETPAAETPTEEAAVEETPVEEAAVEVAAEASAEEAAPEAAVSPDEAVSGEEAASPEAAVSGEEAVSEAPAEEPPTETTVVDAADFLDASAEDQPTEQASTAATLKALLEAVIYITEEPLTLDQIAAAVEQPKEHVAEVLRQLTEEYSHSDRGITIREVAGGFKMATKPEHHEAIRSFVKKMKPPLKLSLAALETLAVIAYKQPITAPEIMDIRGVQGAGVIKTLLDRKLIAIAGRKQVVGKPILYKTTKDFLVQFGLKDLAELPTLKEFEELRRLAFADEDVTPDPVPDPPVPPVTEPEPAAPPITEPVTEPEPETDPEPPAPEPAEAAAGTE